jgi:hypothetical protein
MIPISSTRVKASAQPRMLKFGRPATWEVEVWGEPPHDHRRTYTIVAASDKDAAFEGIHFFVEEMEALDSANED